MTPIQENIKSSFLVSTTNHGAAILSGDHQKANKLHTKLMTLYKQAKNDNCLPIFLELLEDSNESVGLWAATFCLKHSTRLAESRLEVLAKSETIFGLSARQRYNYGKKINLT